MVDEKLVKLITERVIEKIREYQTYKIPIGVSNRHVHVTKEDLEILYGPGYELTKKGDLKQPGQFASNETVTVRGPKGEFKNVRILGPVRSKSLKQTVSVWGSNRRSGSRVIWQELRELNW